MILIKAIEKTYQDLDENGQAITRTYLEPVATIPATAARVVCDGTNYIVYEQGEE